MDTFRLMLFAMGIMALIVINSTLFVWNEGLRVWTNSAQDGWHIECHYYTPFRLFTRQVYLGQDCPARVNAPSLSIFYGHFTVGGMDERIESTLPPVFNPKIVPRS